MESVSENNLLSLKQKAKERIQNTFYGIQDKNKVSNFILIVDKHGLDIFSNYVKMGDLIDYGISGIEKLELKRKPFPNQHAIYFLTPTPESIDTLIEDFSGKEPQYGHIHLLFTSKVNDKLVSLISESPGIKGRLKTFKEINLDFVVTGAENLIDFQMENSLSVFYSQMGSSLEARYKDMASNKLISLLSTIGKFNEIEVAYSLTDNQIAKSIGTNLTMKLRELVSNLESRNSETLDKDAGKVTFLILDRSIDPVIPSLHNYLYRPMLYDLLKVQKDTISVGGAQDVVGTKKHNLSKDKLFQKYKNKHFAEVLDLLPTEIQNFLASNSASKIKMAQAGQKLDLNKMDDVMKSMPEYNQIAEEFTIQQKLAEMLYNNFSNSSLKEIFDIEQTICTGVDSDGKVVNSNKILSKIMPILQSKNVQESDKVRILIATFIYFELAEKDRIQLLSEISEGGVNALKNLKWLGADFIATKTKHKIDEGSKKEIKKNYQDSGLDYGRYNSVIITIIDGIRTRLANRTDLKGFFCGKLTFDSISLHSIKSTGTEKNSKSLRQKKGGFGKSALSGKSQEEQETLVNKLIIFMVGGLSYAEVSLISNVKITNNEAILFFAGTEIINPSQYIHNLSSMEGF